MITLFTSRQPFVFIVLVLLVFTLRIPSFLLSPVYNSDYTAYTFFGDFFIFLNRNKMSTFIVGSLIVLLQTLHLNYIFEKHRVHYKSTFLPALFYVIYASLFNGVDARITPSLLVQTPLMIILGIFFDLYKSVNVRTKIFTGMFVLGVGTLIYFPLSYLVIAFIASLFFVKIPSFRDFMVAIAGVIVPVYFAFVFYYFNGQYNYFMEKTDMMLQFKSNFKLEQTTSELFLLCILGIIILITSFKLYMNHFKNIIKTRIIQQMLFAVSFVSLLILIFLLQFQYQHLLLFIIPFSYLLSYFFFGKWRYMMDEIIATGLLLFIFILKFNPL